MPIYNQDAFIRHISSETLGDSERIDQFFVGEVVFAEHVDMGP